MNIFRLHTRADFAARAHTDVHVNKMITESAQMLCTAHHLLGSPLNLATIMKPVSNPGHAAAVWARECSPNYEWLYKLMVALCDEYTFRGGKTHKVDRFLKRRLASLPAGIRECEKGTPPPLCMPDSYKVEGADVVTCYRGYYVAEKLSDPDIAGYTKRQPPVWA